MARPKGSTNKKKPIDKKKCLKCKKEMALINFYNTNSEMFEDSKVPFCKKCLREMVDETDLNSVKSVLRQIDKPFIYNLWKDAVAHDKYSFGEYMRMINSLPQYQEMTYDDSVDKPEHEVYVVEPKIDEDQEEDEGIIRVTKEVILKWGNGFSTIEYIKLERTWNEMIFSNDISTPQHKNNLLFYCKLVVLMDRALENNEIGDFEKLSRQFDSLIKSSGFRPIDRKSGYESSGVRTFSQIFEEVERDGFIIPADYKESQDIIDRSIMYLINYTRRLLNMETLIEPPPDTPKVDG